MHPLDKFVIVDVETTGAVAHGARVLEVGMVRVEGGKIVDTFEQLLDPAEEIPYFISRLTGISMEDTIGKPDFKSIAPVLKSFLDDAIFVAHNVSFDYSFLKVEMNRLGYEFNYPKLCTVKLSKKLFPNERKHNLGSLIERFEISVEDRHRALADALAVWQFLEKAKSLTSEKVWESAVYQQLGKPKGALVYEPVFE